jgi:hypothetical protein
MYGLVLLVRRPPSAVVVEPARADSVLASLEELIATGFAAFANFWSASFKGPIGSLFRDDADPQEAGDAFLRQLAEFKERAGFPRIMAELIMKAFHAVLDVTLTNHIYMEATKCDFIASLTWNTVVSRLRIAGVELPIFQDAVSVVQMAAVINEDPATVSAICPNLSLKTVMALLSVRETDTELQQAPDVGKFARFYSLNRDEPVTPIEFDTAQLFQVPEDLSTEGWDEVKLPQKVLERCGFLNSRFSQ